MEISKLFIYPIKSLGGISIESSAVEMRGLKYDRRWMLIDENNRFLSQREIPELAGFNLAMGTNDISVTNTRNNESIQVPLRPLSMEMKVVKVWDDELAAQIVKPQICEWFSGQLNKKVSLVYQNEESIRKVDSKFAVTGNEHTSLSDGYPILIISEASVTYLNSICPEYIPAERFRPNIIIKDSEAFAEDKLTKILVGTTELYGVKPCARCIVTTLQPETMKFSKEPLNTLSKFRKFDNKVLFGQNLVVHQLGNISIGDILQ